MDNETWISLNDASERWLDALTGGRRQEAVANVFEGDGRAAADSPDPPAPATIEVLLPDVASLQNETFKEGISCSKFIVRGRRRPEGSRHLASDKVERISNDYFLTPRSFRCSLNTIEPRGVAISDELLNRLPPGPLDAWEFVEVQKVSFERWLRFWLRTHLHEMVKNCTIDVVEGERIAAAQGLEPLEGNPNPGDYDPFTEPYWTIPMTCAWIIWREKAAVTEHWWKFRKRVSYFLYRDSPKGGWREHKQSDPSTLITLSLSTTWKQAHDSRNMPALSVVDAMNEIAREVGFGRLQATGIHSLQAMRVAIPTFEWQSLKYEESHGKDILRMTSNDRHFYEEVSFPSSAVLELWPPTAGRRPSGDLSLNRASFEDLDWPLPSAATWITLKEPADANDLTLSWALQSRDGQAEENKERANAIADGWRQLQVALKSGKVGACSKQAPREISAAFWERAQLRLDAETGTDYFEIENTGAEQSAIKERHDAVTVNALEVRAVWPHPAEGHVCIWDFAIEKSNLDIPKAERMVVNLFADFWRGTFAPEGLYLRETSKGSSAVSHSPQALGRRELARAATGQVVETDELLDATTRELQNWGIENYTNAANGRSDAGRVLLDLYFHRGIRNHGISFKQNTGLCARRELLSEWYLAPVLESGTFEKGDKTKSASAPASRPISDRELEAWGENYRASHPETDWTRDNILGCGEKRFRERVTSTRLRALYRKHAPHGGQRRGPKRPSTTPA